MKNNYKKIVAGMLVMMSLGTATAVTSAELSEMISGMDTIYNDDNIDFSDIMLISNDLLPTDDSLMISDPWNADVNPTPAPEGAVNSPVPISTPRTIANFADYAVDFGYGKIQDHWAEGQIAVLYGYEGVAGIEVDGVLEFQANRSITITELASLILNNGNVELDMNLGWQERTLKSAKELNMITDDMIAKAGEPILREEMAYMLVQGGKSLDIIFGESVPYDGVISDINEADEQFRKSIEEAYVLGLLAGDGTGYKPKNATTRAETCAIVNRLFGYTDRVR